VAIKNSPYTVKDDLKLMTEIWDPRIATDPLAFVRFIFPWGKPGTPLEHHKGPKKWQVEELTRIRDHTRNNLEMQKRGETPLVYRSATSSGRGVGKSALTAWMNLWMLSCIPGSTSITTANTGSQLETRTWAELARWHTIMLNSHWFERTSLKLFPAPGFKEAIEKHGIGTGYYYAQAQLWQEENTDAFAGAHNPLGFLLIFDEASGIPEKIWDVSTGFFSDISPYRYWLAFSNPRRNTGAFFECFHKSRDYWQLRNLDSRTVEGIDIAFMQEIVDRHGEDSDQARIEVKGEFPRQGDRQFISREVIDGAIAREIEMDHHAGLIMGVDVARFGDDTTVIRFRRGRDAKSIKATKLKGKDNMQVANECAMLIDEHKPDAVCVDAGNGTGVIDRLREMGYKVVEVWFGSKSNEEEWSDFRTELWAKMREWLQGGCIDSDARLKQDLLGPEYEFDKLERIKLEAKEKMKRRGVASPDDGDALAVTFATKVARTDMRAAKQRGGSGRKVSGADYDVFSR
jgi:hypothetical protein